MKKVAIVGAGLAGCEAALVLAAAGVPVDLFEMRPGTMTPAHKTDLPAELVCSNSFKAQGTSTAHSLLKNELALLKSPLLDVARSTSVPAGCALAVDREEFSRAVLTALSAQPGIRVIRTEVAEPPAGYDLVILAPGPLASKPLTDWIAATFSGTSLNFYDAIAPIVSADSLDMKTAFFAERKKPESTDYINCPFNREEYDRFCTALIEADTATARDFENAKFFEACLPIEVLARRGPKSLAFGPLKPIDLVDPRTGRWPWAVCQLRRENKAGESYNMVGFQTRLRIPEQQRVFRLIPGMENAEFLRFGSIHRNTYIDSPMLLNADLSFRTMPTLFVAGQLCGGEGYTESIATGHAAARFVIARLNGRELPLPPVTTALGALLNHVCFSDAKPFTPSNVNYGLFPVLPNPGPRKIGKMVKQELMCKRAEKELGDWVVRHLDIMML